MHQCRTTAILFTNDEIIIYEKEELSSILKDIISHQRHFLPDKSNRSTDMLCSARRWEEKLQFNQKNTSLLLCKDQNIIGPETHGAT